MVATVGSDPAAADVELLEQALMTLFLLATNDGLKPDVRAAVEDASADRILGNRRCEVLVFGSKTV